MNPLHFPSLELCKKLTESGFPRTQYQYEKNNYKRSKKFGEVVFWDCGYSYTDDKTWLLEAVCPSVMELLDAIEQKKGFQYGEKCRINIEDMEVGIYVKDSDCRCSQYCGGYDNVSSKEYTTLPNALAEMWLWLKENGYLSIK